MGLRTIKRLNILCLHNEIYFDAGMGSCPMSKQTVLPRFEETSVVSLQGRTKLFTRITMFSIIHNSFANVYYMPTCFDLKYIPSSAYFTTELMYTENKYRIFEMIVGVLRTCHTQHT
jgi:hypothetical protein